MAKRFIETDLFQDPFVRSLEAPEKLLWIYLFCNCDNAGTWTVELDVACLRIGVKVTEKKALEAFKGKVVVLDDGYTWFLPSFIKIQHKNELKATNSAHTKVIPKLLSYDLIEENESGFYNLKPTTLEAPSKPLHRGGTGRGRGRGSGSMVEVKVKEPKPKIEIQYPYQDEDFLQAWQAWKDHRFKQHKFKYKSVISEQAAMTHLASLGDSKEICIKIIAQSIRKPWKDFYSLKQENNGQAKTPLTQERFDDIIENGCDNF